MEDVYKTKRQLIDEVNALRKQVAAAKGMSVGHGSVDDNVRRFAAAVDAVQLGVTISDTEGTILHTNPADARMHGYDTDELIGKNARIYAPPSRWRFLSTDQLLRRIDWRRESINIRKDRSTFPVELLSNVVRNRAGEPIGKVTICEDITLQKQVERSRRDRDEHIRLVLEATSEGVWDWNVTTGEVIFSDQWLESLGYARGELESTIQTWEQLTHPDDLPRVIKRLHAHLDGRTDVYRCEKRMLTKSGEWRWKLDRGKVIRRDDNGDALRMVGVDADVTDRRRSEAERRYVSSIVESTEDGVVGMSLDGEIVSWNPAAERLFGYTADEAIRQHMGLVVPADRQEEIPRILEQVKAGEHLRQYETVGLHKDGSAVECSLTVSPIRDTAGQVSGAAVLVRDITDRRVAAEALHLSEERYRDLFEYSQGLICTHTLDGVLVSTNPAGAQLFGYEPSEIVGRKLEDFLAPSVRHLGGEYLQRVQGEGTSSGLMRIITKDGHERLLAYRNSVRRDPQGEPYVIGHAQDITDLRQAEDELRRSEAQYRELFESAKYGIFSIDAGGDFLRANPVLVAMLGYETEDEVRGLNFMEHVYAGATEQAALLQQQCEERAFDDIDCQWKRRDGKIIQVRLSGRLVCNAEGDVEHFEVFAEDVTQQRALEAQLRQAQKMEAIGQLTGGMAHDFNNVLTVILACADLIAAAMPADQRALQADLAELQAAARSGSAMIKRLLGFSRRTVLAPKALDVHALVQDILVTLRRLLPESIEVRYVGERSLPPIEADPAAIEQILMNLVTNARDAMAYGGRIDIETTRVRLDDEHRLRFGWGEPGDYAVLSVQDDGSGMDAQTKEKVFEPFFTTKSPEQGTGLGLSMVYGLVKQHRGYVEVASELGDGTVVKVYFPLSTAEAPNGAQVEEHAELRGGSETILFVEDEPAIRRAAKRVLEHHGYTVLSAADGEEALSLFHTKKDDIALVVSDLVMPKLSGLDLFEALRRERADLKFLWASGYALPDVRETVPSDDFVAFLQKPWMPDELVMQVRHVLDGASVDAVP